MKLIKKYQHQNHLEKDRARKNKGFSLVELSIAIAILAILAFFLVPSLLSYNERSRLQKDISAMDEITHSIIFSLSDEMVYNEVVKHSRLDNISCYIDQKSESAYDPVITKVAGNAAAQGAISQYTFDSDSRTADETPFYGAGNMRGLTITFEPQKKGAKSIYTLKEGVINKLTSNGTTKLKDLPYLYNASRVAIGEDVKLTSSTYRNSEFTVFIRLGSNGGKDSEQQTATVVYGQFSGTNLPDDATYSLAENRVTGDSGADYDDNDKENNDKPSYDEGDLGGTGTFYPGDDDEYNHDAPSLHPTDGSTPKDGDVYEYGDYIYLYQKDGAGGYKIGGWFVRINEEVTDRNRTSYGPILESINGKPIVALCLTFADCPNLTKSPVIPRNVVYMDGTYTRCNSLTDLSDLVIHENVQDMYETFHQCDNLTVAPNMNNASGVKNMRHTFGYCTNLQTVPTIPENVVDLSWTFIGCDSLTDVGHAVIPSSVTTMIQTFSWCDNLTVAPNMDNASGLLNMRSTFSGCVNMKTAPTIPNNVVNMSSTFSNCSSLSKAPAIPSGVTKLDGAFYGCTSLSDISDLVVPRNVDDMDSMFSGCTALQGTLTINADMKKAETPKHRYESYLHGVDFDVQNLTLVGDAPMLDYFGDTGAHYCAECNGTCLNPQPPSTGDIYRKGNYLYIYNKYYSCFSKSWVTSDSNSWGVLCEYNVADPGPILETLKGKPVTNMQGTFYQCTSLTTAPTIPNSITNMKGAFYGCASLKNAPDIPNSVTDLSYAFYACSSLLDAPDIPNGVTTMQYTFGGCALLNDEIVIPQSVKDLYYTFSGCKALTHTPTISGGVTNMSCTFYECEKLKDAPIIPNGVTNISSAFYGCKSLANAPIIPGSVKNMYRTFYNCKNLTDAPEIPSEVTNMAYAFYGCSSLDDEIIIPQKVTNLSYAFSGCQALTHAPTINKSATNMTNMSYSFYNCERLKVAPIVPSGVTDLSYAFYGCRALTNGPSIPTSVTKMSYTFYGCSSLTGPMTMGASAQVNSNCSKCFGNVDFQAQNITLVGNGAILDTLGATGINYCSRCNGKCSGHDEPQTGAIYKSGNYEYRYNQYYHYHAKTWFNSSTPGWGVRCINNVANPGPILESIEGQPVTNMYNAFYGCNAVKTAPTIPSTVKDMYQTFAYCTSLTGTITINTNPNKINQCFLGVDFNAQNLRLVGTSSILGPIVSTGTNYCSTCKGKCDGTH